MFSAPRVLFLPTVGAGIELRITGFQYCCCRHSSVIGGGGSGNKTDEACRQKKLRATWSYLFLVKRKGPNPVSL
ncbi:hypothetical protein KCP73_23845 [Salmonella enterica subsp. enterica]|nr:hypothetical protein KCP73_23845 [Salmonella enterica subsp. enterica]